MDSLILFLLYSLALIGVSLVAAFLPQYGKVKGKNIHHMVAVSTGIFLGLLLFMLLPEAIEESEEGGFDTHYVMFVLALGFILILILNVILKERHAATCACHAGEHYHEATSISSFIGLAIHAACDGLALAAMFMAGEEVGLMATIGFSIHKFAELFSLSSTMLMTKLDKRKAMIRLIGFSLITPIAGLIFVALFGDMEVEGLLGLPLAFAAGTLMYVTMCDMVPESFGHSDKRYRTTALIILGVALMLAVALLFPHAH
jgi:zinc transporter ZupT